MPGMIIQGRIALQDCIDKNCMSKVVLWQACLSSKADDQLHNNFLFLQNFNRPFYEKLCPVFYSYFTYFTSKL